MDNVEIEELFFTGNGEVSKNSTQVSLFTPFEFLPGTLNLIRLPTSLLKVHIKSQIANFSRSLVSEIEKLKFNFEIINHCLSSGFWLSS